MESLRTMVLGRPYEATNGFSGNATAEVPASLLRPFPSSHGSPSTVDRTYLSQPGTCNNYDESVHVACESLRPETSTSDVPAEDISSRSSAPHSLFVKKGKNSRGSRAQTIVQPMPEECSTSMQCSRAASIRKVSISMRRSSHAVRSTPCHAWLPEATQPPRVRALARWGSERPFPEREPSASLPKSSSARDLEPHMRALRPPHNLTLTYSFGAPDPQGARCSAALRVTRRTLAELDVMSAALASSSGSGIPANSLPAIRAIQALAASDDLKERLEVARVLCPRTDAVASLQPVDLEVPRADRVAASGGLIHLSGDQLLSTRLCSRTDAAADLKQGVCSQQPSRLQVTPVQHIGTIALADWEDEQRPSTGMYRPERPATPHPDKRRLRLHSSSERLGGDDDEKFSDEEDASVEEGLAAVTNPLAVGRWAARMGRFKGDGQRQGKAQGAPGASALSKRRGNVSCGTSDRDRWRLGGAGNDGETGKLTRTDDRTRRVLHEVKVRVARLGCGLWPSPC